MYRPPDNLLSGHPQDLFSRSIQQNNAASSIGDHYPIGNAFQDGPDFGGLLLLSAQHAPHSFGRLPDHPIELSVIDGCGNLTGRRRDQLEVGLSEIAGLGMVEKEHP